jgi:hypothetical protein
MLHSEALIVNFYQHIQNVSQHIKLVNSEPYIFYVQL